LGDNLLSRLPGLEHVTFDKATIPDGSLSITITLRVGDIPREDGETFKIWTYLTPHRNPNASPTFHFHIFDQFPIPEQLEDDTLLDQSNMTDGDFERFKSKATVLPPFDRLEHKEQFKAVVRYYFALAAEAELLDQDNIAITGTNDLLMKHLTAACNTMFSEQSTSEYEESDSSVQEPSYQLKIPSTEIDELEQDNRIRSRTEARHAERVAQNGQTLTSYSGSDGKPFTGPKRTRASNQVHIRKRQKNDAQEYVVIDSESDANDEPLNNKRKPVETFKRARRVVESPSNSSSSCPKEVRKSSRAALSYQKQHPRCKRNGVDFANREYPNRSRKSSRVHHSRHTSVTNRGPMFIPNQDSSAPCGLDLPPSIHEISESIQKTSLEDDSISPRVRSISRLTRNSGVGSDRSLSGQPARNRKKAKAPVQTEALHNQPGMSTTATCYLAPNAPTSLRAAIMEDLQAFNQRRVNRTAEIQQLTGEGRHSETIKLYEELNWLDVQIQRKLDQLRS
jgi:hypothetical protein